MRLLAISLALMGCSTTRAVSVPLTSADVASIDDEVKGRSAAIRLRNEPCCRSADDVVVSSGAVEWTEESKPGRMRAPPEAVDRITVRDHTHGALAGAGVGLAVGVALGALVGIGFNGQETAYFMRSVSVIGLGITGALVFGLGGAIIGAPHHIDLKAPPP